MQSNHKPNIQKVIETFGKEKGLELLAQEYRDTANTELEITKLRWTIYTAFIGISLVFSGYLFSNPDLDPTLIKIGLVAGIMVHLVAYYFYWWLHRTALMYRDYLRSLEQEIGFTRYSIRLDRPKIGGLTIRFYWGIVALLVAHVVSVILYLLVG